MNSLGVGRLLIFSKSHVYSSSLTTNSNIQFLPSPMNHSCTVARNENIFFSGGNSVPIEFLSYLKSFKANLSIGIMISILYDQYKIMIFILSKPIQKHGASFCFAVAFHWDLPAFPIPTHHCAVAGLK